MKKLMEKKELFQYILVAFIVLGFFAVVILLMLNAIPEKNEGSLQIILGALTGAFLTIINYFTGSSLSSAKKDETIAQLKKPEPTEPTQ